MTPDSELMHVYGTDLYFLEKSGAIPAGSLLAMTGLASLVAGMADKSHQDHLLAEAEAMNVRLQALEAARMSPVIAGFTGKTASLDPELQKIAEDIGMRLADEMEKEAIIGAGLKFLGTVGKNLLGKLPQSGTAKFLGAAERAGLGGVARGALKPPSIGGGMTQKAVTGLQAAPQAAKAVSKPFIGFGTKAKVLGAAGLAGAGYLGYKGLQTARDYMMMPSHSSTWGAYGSVPQHQVGGPGGGYPQY